MQGNSRIVNNVFVCYDRSTPEDRAEEIAGTVQRLGRTSMLYPCCWYLETSLEVSEVKTKVSATLSDNDVFVVVDATNHQAAWKNIRPDAAELIHETWPAGALPSYLQRIASKRDKRNPPDKR